MILSGWAAYHRHVISKRRYNTLLYIMSRIAFGYCRCLPIPSTRIVKPVLIPA
ncbi:MAG: hypothetical protein KGZ88_19195 [Methylomicrobium sp.]|nr:hypothetical protein [Methylomicrobium sp.]